MLCLFLFLRQNKATNGLTMVFQYFILRDFRKFFVTLLFLLSRSMNIYTYLYICKVQAELNMEYQLSSLQYLSLKALVSV